MGLQHPLVGQQPPGNPLGVVEPVHADQHPDAPVAPERLRLGLDRRVLRQRSNDAASIPIGKTPEPHLAAGKLDPVDVHGEAQDVGQRGGEVAQVGRRVEADEVGAEHPSRSCARAGRVRNSSSDGKRDVEEEADPGVGKPARSRPGRSSSW